MSWLTKMTDLAGKAENILNKIDQQTGDAIQQQISASKNPSRSGSVVNVRHEDTSESYIEELGRSGLSLPSRTHSEFAGGVPIGRRKANESFVPTTSTLAERDRLFDDSVSVINEDVLHMGGTGSVQGGGERSRRSSGRSAVSINTSIISEQPDVSQMKSQIWAKDSQIAVLKTKVAEVERKLEKRSQDFYELKAEKELIEQRVSTQFDSDSIEELKLARKKVQEQKEMIQDENNQLKKKNNALEDDVRAIADQLRLAKFNLNANKQEFDEYKEKAQKILHAKEKLVESLKTEQGMVSGSEKPVHLLLAELEEMKVERDLARTNLESAQIQLYNMRGDVEDLENQLREEQTRSSEQRRQHLEERQTWQASTTLINEKLDCAKIESEFVRGEMKRQNDEFAKRMDTKEMELRQAMDDSKSRRREEEYRAVDGQSTSQRLLNKQMELEEALKNNQILTLRLERIQKGARDTSVFMEGVSATPTQIPMQNPTGARQAVSVVDQTVYRLVSMLRTNPSARIFFAIYFLVLHLWLFFIVCTYTPEIHDGMNMVTGGLPDHH